MLVHCWYHAMPLRLPVLRLHGELHVCGRVVGSVAEGGMASNSAIVFMVVMGPDNCFQVALTGLGNPGFRVAFVSLFDMLNTHHRRCRHPCPLCISGVQHVCG